MILRRRRGLYGRTSNGRKLRGRTRRFQFERLEHRHLLSANPVINELLASNGDVIQDEDGDYPDFIELYNQGDATAQLGGWYLTDNQSNLTKWQLPPVDLAPGEYLVVFASGKDRAIAGSQLHTNFALSIDGEYLGLVQPDGTTVASQFAPEFPPQFRDVSYGIGADETLRYFETPTPGAANGVGVIDFVSAVETSQGHGFFDASFTLELNTPTTGTEIYYTYDGSIPHPDNSAAILYQSPIIVDTTTVFRAAAYKDDFAPSPITTQTYVFLDDVLTQTIDPNNPANNPFGLDYPAIWQGGFTGDFNMDPSVVAQWDDDNPANEDFGLREGLLSIPTMSIVMDHDDLWNASTGIYPNATNEGDFWRRASSIEYINPNTGEQFQYNAGVQMHGGASRDNARLKKHSFRLIFSGEFDGPGTLEFPLFDNSDFADINTVVLKAAFTDSFPTRTITNRYSPLDSTYTRDVWMFDSQRAMGSLAPDATYVHLYINGLYWGLYYPVERTDDAFLTSHIGGDQEDWDVIKDFNELFRGNKDAWNAMFDLARNLSSASPSAADAIYYELQGRNPDGTLNPAMPVYLDVDNLIDYMILHIYAGAEDWPHHNWVAGRNRVDPGTGFQFFTWDQEIVLDGRFRDRTDVSNADTPAELYSLLRNSPEFRLRFSDRVQKHLFNDGALTVEASQERWMQRADQIEAAIIGESARWGDARAGEVVNVPPTTTIPTMTVDHWRASVAEVMGYFSQSHALAISRFTADGLFTPPLPGDFDGDGDVDGADFVVWQTNFPTVSGATLATGDADGDGDVDGADFVIWQTNFPTTPSPATAGATLAEQDNPSVVAEYVNEPLAATNDGGLEESPDNLGPITTTTAATTTFATGHSARNRRPAPAIETASSHPQLASLLLVSDTDASPNRLSFVPARRLPPGSGSPPSRERLRLAAVEAVFDQSDFGRRDRTISYGNDKQLRQSIHDDLLAGWSLDV